MISALFLSAILALAEAADDHPAEKYYRELNCQPIIEPGQTEPSRYDCSHLNNRKDDQCFHKGKFYNIGQTLPDEEVSPCVTHCRCREGYQSPAEFNCINIECPSLFGVRPKEGCYNQYESDKCCATKEHCENDGETATCDWEGKTYKEGEKFYPSEHKCLGCVCMKGFDGTIGEPWCKKFSCDLNLHYGNRLRKGCVPTYYKNDDCCPIPVFRCPGDDDKIEGEPLATAKSEDNQCIFGSLKIGKGQKLNNDPDNKCVRCSCDVPPHVTCTMDTDCYEGKSA